MPHPAPLPHAALSPWMRRLFSLSGVLPLGAFLLGHAAVHAAALRSDAAFVRVIAAIHRVPALALLEGLFVLLPLLFHAAVGTWLVLTGRSLADKSPYPPSMRVAVRATGLATAAFLALHLPEFRFRTLGDRLDPGTLATWLAADLSVTWRGVPWRGATYLVGAGCATFHFVAGAWAFFVTARRGLGERERARAAWAAAGVGAALWVLFADVVVFQATGARMLAVPAADADTASEPCPPGR